MNEGPLNLRWRELRRYLNWGDEDALRIRSAVACLQPSLQALVDDFYAMIEEHSQLRQILTGGAEQVSRLKASLLGWLKDLLTGPYDDAYAKRRFAIGLRHVELRLEPLYVQAGMSRIRQGLLHALLAGWPGSTDALKAVIASLNKLLDIDLALIEAAYHAKHESWLRSSLKAAHGGAFRQLVECVPCLVIISRPDCTVLHVSPTVEEMIGYSVEELLNKNYLDLLVPDATNRAAITDWFHESTRATQTYRTTVPLRSKDGSLRKFVWNSHTLPEYDGGPAILAVGQDVTELTQAEEALRASQHFVQKLVDASPNIIYVFDLEKRRNVYTNRQISSVLGYTPDQVAMEHTPFLNDNFHPDDTAQLAQARERHRAATNGEVIQTEYRIRHANGEWCWLQSRDVVFSRHEDGTPREILGVAKDITDRKRHEERLARSEAQYRRLFDADLTGDFVVKPTGELVLCNPAFAHMLGYASTQELLAASDFTLFPNPEDKEMLKHVLLSEHEQGIHERSLVRCDGRTISVIENLVRISGQEPGAWQIQGFLLDITERQQMQQQLLQMERLAAIGQMVAGLAHESRNALQLIQASTEMLALEVQNQPDALEIVKDIQEAENSLERLHEDVRQYAAPMKLHRHRQELAEVWHEAWTQLSPQRENRQAYLRENVAGVDLHCLVDRMRLVQVLRNIFINSLDACRDPVEITLTCRGASIRGRPALQVVIRDNGPGLSAEQRQRIFEPFFTTKLEGTGLGLAIARRIVEAHGGEIGLGTADGPGAEIEITLPRGET